MLHKQRLREKFSLAVALDIRFGAASEACQMSDRDAKPKVRFQASTQLPQLTQLGHLSYCAVCQLYSSFPDN
ncbi:hypothetical protein SAMN05192568_102762 [Methylobacterium pseudosasicola]|uniref:Uncharacterized protein n=1 Tax=Methylobacterium pseudosasicola TaxID=582667 RepID=A0A1I4Q085_9HYPH|nr:hypothetical protein SAMN05192568_102762 [Methylobacterium pseudosasicola]